MTPFIITHCTVDDGPQISRNNMSAYWLDENWVYIWKNVTLEDVIAAKAHRYPQVFLQSRSTTRHLKALDPITHDIVGYIRWKIPSTHCTESDGSPVWPEGQVPGVSDEQKRDIDRAGNLADAQLKPLEFEGEDDLDAVIGRRRDHFLAQKPYIVLDYIAVHPDHQNKGIGTALVRNGLESLKGLGLDVSILAFQRGIRLYEKIGCTTVDTIVQDARRVGGNDHYEVRLMEYRFGDKDQLHSSLKDDE